VDARFVALVVEQDPETRAQVAGSLEDAGFVVLTCGGPMAPDVACPAGDGGVCPLADSADIVVLDLELASDTMFEGMPGWQLLSYYCDTGKPVVAIAEAGELVSPGADERLEVVRRPVQQDTLVRACRSVLQRVTLDDCEPETRVGDLAVVRAPRWSRHPVGAAKP
jgi:DNA-binding response OmpR family regulator